MSFRAMALDAGRRMNGDIGDQIAIPGLGSQEGCVADDVAFRLPQTRLTGESAGCIR